MNAANHADTRGQNHGDQYQHPGKKALEHAVHQRDTFWWLQQLQGGAEK